MLQILLISLHVLAGAAAILFGFGAMSVKKKQGWHTQIGNLYHAAFVVVAVTASALAILNWKSLWWFLPVAIFSYAFALLGFLAAKLKFKNWLRFHLLGQGGSFIALFTALLAVNFGSISILPWIIPTLIGTPILIWFKREIKAGRRPKYS